MSDCTVRPKLKRKFGVTAEQMAKASTDFFNKFPSVNGKEADSLQDSREKLEAEIRYEYNGSINNEAEQIIEWLDRQAAITEHEVLCHPDERDEQIAELQAKVDDLKEELEDEKSENGWVRDFLNRMGRKCGTKDCPSLVAYVGQLEAENEQLREKLSRAYDNAHDTLRTM